MAKGTRVIQPIYLQADDKQYIATMKQVEAFAIKEHNKRLVKEANADANARAKFANAEYQSVQKVNRWKWEQEQKRLYKEQVAHQNALNKKLAATRSWSAKIIKAINRVGMAVGVAFAYHEARQTIERLTTAYAEFEYQMARVNTIAKLDEASLAKLTDEARRQAVILKTSPVEYAAALYETLSASVPLEKAINTTTQAVKLSIAGFADKAATVRTVAAVMNKYGDDVGAVRDITDSLLAVQNRGIVTIGELASGLGKSIPVSKSLGVYFRVLGAATAVLTAGGMDADEALTSIRRSFLSLATPSEGNLKVYKELNIAWSESRLKGENFVGLLEEIVQKTQDAPGGMLYNMSRLGIEARALPAILDLGSTSLAKFRQEIRYVDSAAGLTEEGVAEMNATLKKAFEGLGASFESFGAVVNENQKITSVVNSLAESIMFLADAQKQLNDMSSSKAFKDISAAYGSSPIIASILKSGIAGQMAEIDNRIRTLESYKDMQFGPTLPTGGFYSQPQKTDTTGDETQVFKSQMEIDTDISEMDKQLEKLRQWAWEQKIDVPVEWTMDDAFAESEKIIKELNGDTTEYNHNIERTSVEIEWQVKLLSYLKDNWQALAQSGIGVATNAMSLFAAQAQAAADAQSMRTQQLVDEQDLVREAYQAAGLEGTKQYEQLVASQQKALSEQQAREEAAKSKAWEQQRMSDITQATAAGSLAFVKSLPNYILAGLTAASTALQVATITAQQNPYRAAFGWEVPGQPAYGDYYPAVLSAGERVMDPTTSRRYSDDLDAMNDGSYHGGGDTYITIQGDVLDYDKFYRNKILPAERRAKADGVKV